VIASPALNGAPEAVRRLTMSWMPSSGAPSATGRSELPEITTPASRRLRCRYSHETRSGPTDAIMPSGVCLARSAMRAYSSSRLVTRQSTSVSVSPNPIMWLCASWKPGISVAPLRSMTSFAVVSGLSW
jgi:hypothetical protein